ncbi:MAG: cyclic nucleotide-binding domain-containing protein [Gammaproteobacteria bacterium]
MAEDKKKSEKEEYADLIRQLIPVNELSQDVQNQLINEASIIKVRKKDTIFKQGDRDNFSYYLLDGQIELQANKQVHNTITSGTDQARYAMAQLQPRQFSGVAKVPSVVMQLSRDSLDRYMLLNQEKSEEGGWGDGSGMEVEVSELSDEDDVDWMSRLLQSDIFDRMPTANIHQLFALLEPIEYSAGDVVVKQGEPGEHYYIIQEGRCQVSRAPSSGSKDIKLAELGTGDSFGEEALLAETTRNATVSMITDGILMRLSKEHFNDLVRDPTLHSVAFDEADKQVQAGKAKWLDIRYQNEHERSSIEGSLHIPLNMLRMQMDEKLDRDTYFILYCETGGRSSAAAFLLSGAGFNVSYLKGGLVNNPGAADPTDVTDVPKPQPTVPESQSAESPVKPETKPPGDAAPEPAAEEKMDPEVKASYLETQLNRTNMELEKSAKEEGKDEALEKARMEERKKLEQERARLEAEKKKAEEEAKKLRQQEEGKLKKLEEEAKKRIEAEKKRLEEIYSRNTEEMEKLEKMKKEAEEEAGKERERIEKQAAAAKNDKGEAERLRKELEASRQKMAEEEKKRKKEQEELERKIQMQARQKLEVERKKMAEEYAKHNQELEQAKRERAAAEAARVAAKKEAEKLISEYKSEHEKTRAEDEERLRREREKLEEDQRKIQETLKETQTAREEAEALKKTAMDEVAALREKQKQAAAKAKSDQQDALKTEIKQAEAKLHKAKINVAQTQQQTIKIQEQRRLNTADLESNKEAEEELRKRLEEDLADFKEELKEEEEERAGMRTQIEYMRRIRERAEAAKNEAKSANSDLLSDIEDQLGNKK